MALAPKKPPANDTQGAKGQFTQFTRIHANSRARMEEGGEKEVGGCDRQNAILFLHYIHVNGIL